MLQPGDLVPHFEVTLLDGRHVAYRAIWQQQNLLLVTLPAADEGAPAYADHLTRRMDELRANQTAVLLTHGQIPGLPAPALLVADRWGEVHFVRAAANAVDLPSPDEVLEWLRFTQYACPECEGEWR